jgi:hypothetical protein
MVEDADHAQTAHLENLVRTVAAAWPGWERAGPGGKRHLAPWGFLVGVTAAGTFVPRRLRDHPGRVLRGFIAPPHWQAVAVAVHGTARRLGGPPEHATPTDGDDARAAVVWLCDRRGASASWLLLPGQSPQVTVNATARPDPGSHGVVAGLLRRAMTEH